jgi:gephyrin
LLPVTQALEIISQHAQCLNTVIMPFSQFLPSYVLSEDVQSTEPVPGYRASIVDGYAVYGKFE